MVNYFTLKVTFLTSFLASSESLSTELSSPAAITFNLEEEILALIKMLCTLAALALDSLSL
jgi:hypothetical protein